MNDTAPQTEKARLLRQKLSPKRWQQKEKDAKRCAQIVEAVAQEHKKSGLSLRESLKKVAPEVPWPTFVQWKRRYKQGSGPAWERLLDHRIPPPPEPISQEVRQAACMLRRANRSIDTTEARKHLKAQFGDTVRGVSDASLRRIWAEAGLTYQPPQDRLGQVPGEKVQHFHGGAGLALLGVAEAELGTSEVLANAVLQTGQMHADAQGEVDIRVEPEGARDERGQFTSIYNAWCRQDAEQMEADQRWDTDEAKGQHRVLAELSTLKHSQKVLGDKLLCMGLMPLLTERRGFVGLEGPAGQWLEVLGVHAYMPRTLDKSLTELGLLGVSDALWEVHAKQWNEQANRWAQQGPQWQRWAIYVDASLDPYWTRHFALSGKVSRTGRLMPCLDRVSVTSGPGVPLVMETHVGTVSLKTYLVPLLRQLEGWVGDGELGRLTIIDAEMANARLLWTLDQELDRGFITVLKGKALEVAECRDYGPWQAFRERDEVRELVVVLFGQGLPDDGFEMRGVEMRRPSSRRKQTTLFLCNWDSDELSTAEVAQAYLSRWPNQEQGFRNGRNGGGLERSHGYGGQFVTNIAFDTKVEKAGRKFERAHDALIDAKNIQDTVAASLAEQKNPSHKDSAMKKQADSAITKAEEALRKANNDLVNQCKMPREIYARDAGRDNVMTCLKLNCLLLLEFVLKEYFGDLRMEWRTFIEQFVMMPLTVRTSRNRILYQLHCNDRQPKMMDHLRSACETINKRRIHRGPRFLKFEVITLSSGGSLPAIGNL